MTVSASFRRLLAACALALALPALGQAPSEDAIKAAYLVKLRNYVEWPARADGPVVRTVIGVVGADDIAEQLAQMPSVRDSGRSGIVIKRLRLGDPVAGIHILFIGESAWSRAGAMVAQAREQAVLVASESDGALAGGSVINFRLVDERIRF